MPRTPSSRTSSAAPLHVSTLVVLTLLLAGARAGRAGVIVDHNPTAFDARYDRFVSGYPTAPVPNTSANFIGQPYDLSGIGWRDAAPINSITLVSPRHFIGNFHVIYQVGEKLDFFDPVANVVRQYTVQNLRRMNTTIGAQTLPSDVLLGTLTADPTGATSVPIPASDHINFFPVASAGVVGSPMLNYGQNPAYGAGNQDHLGRNNITAIDVVTQTMNSPPNPPQDLTMSAFYDYTPSNPGEFYLIGGDSGGPSFIPFGTNQIALLGGHIGVSVVTTNPQPGDLSFDSYLPFYVAQINSFMAQDTDATHPNGYSLTLASVPEPGTFALVGLAAAGFGAVRRRRPPRTPGGAGA
jgi:hypothetical protein